ERRQVLERLSAPALAAPDTTIPALFRAQVERAPHATALVWRDGLLSYAELDARAAAVARRLRAAGVRGGERVAVLAEHSPEAIAALLGVMMAGGAFLPLDPGSPAERLAFTLDDAGAAAVLAQPHLANRLPATTLPIIPLIAEMGGAVPADTGPAIPYSLFPIPSSLAYVLYTSGSTGRPKGVGVSHAALAVHLASCVETYGFTADDRVIAFAALTFDPWLEEVLAPLCAGASVALRDPAVWSPAELAEAVERMGITFVDVPTAYWHQLVDDAPSAEAVKRAARLVGTGGEAMRPDAAAAWAALPGDAVLLNGYGPTEAVITATAWRVDGAVAASVARLPIGTPFPGRVARVLDARGEPVPAGVPGELCLGGAALADGYLGRPALTAAAFVPDPFATEPGARLYRTGDRVRWKEVRECESAKVRKWNDDEEGEASGVSTLALSHSRTFALEFLGRVDQQLKVRGFRVEPGEIEAALRASVDVADAAVVARPDATGAARLVAYVVPAIGAKVDVDALRRLCAARMPEYMVPSAFVALDAIPMTANGKVDRRALPEPDLSGDADAYVAPRTPTEEIVADVWAELLGVDRVGARDGFFALGGHSLLGTRVVSRIRDRLGAEVPLAALFEAPRLDAFAARVDDAVRAGLGVSLPPIRHFEGDTAPLSFAQERLWFIDRLEPGTAAYNMSPALRLHGAMDVDAMRRALAEIVHRHEPLRTA
ncbi:MAG TPA: amino acid adenylation domain-containing protein, partial [Longimicrobium sp.]|nr:amino acid adenylation domain-containing protein [Longimicrobium sp.]